MAINDSGSAVGYLESPLACSCPSQAALFSGGTTTLLPPIPGGDTSTYTIANAINNAGQVVGTNGTPDAAGAPTTPVLWFNGTVTALQGIGQAWGINNTGQIVGAILINSSNGGQELHAAVWMSADAKPLDLNQALDPATPPVSAFPNAGGTLVLLRATAINDSGWIVAAGSIDGGTTYQSFLLQPEALSLNLTPISLTFASQTVATTSAAQSVTVNNIGATAFNLSGLQVSGDYSQENNCGSSIAANSSCAIQVKFSPTLPGTRSGVLTLSSGGTGYEVTLTGKGAISLAFAGSASTAALGTPVTLTWTAPGTTCTPTGGSTTDGWTGNLSGSGSLPVAETTAGKYTYGITCTGGGQTANAQVTVSVGQPTVNFGASPTTVAFGKATTLTWTSTFATSCTASGGANGDGWSGTKAISGSASVSESASGSYYYTFACGTISVMAKGMAVVTVNPIPSSGGGGAIDALSLLTMVMMLGMRRRRAM